MKISKKVGIIFITIFAFMFKLNVVNADEMTCEYEMYPINYRAVDGQSVAQPVEKNYTDVARIIYKGSSKSDYKIKSESRFGLNNNHSEFKDKDFAKNVHKTSKCPPYILRTGKGNIKIISDQTKFIKEINTFYENSNEYKYPLVLVKQNGKATSDSELVINEAVKHWIKIMNDKNLSSDSGVVQLETKFIKSLKNSSIYNSKISKYKKLTDYIQSKKDSETLESKENIQKNASDDNCYYYCSSVHCKNQKEGTAKDQCINTCNTSIKPKCNEAYDSCKGISDSTAYSNCLRNALSSKGLDSNYVDIRSQEMADLSKEIQDLRKSIKTNTATKVKIEFEPYKLKCDDVKIFHNIWIIIIIIAPVLVILMGTLDFGQAVISSNEDKIQKAWKKFPKRILALVILILVPWLISLLLSLTTNEGARDTNLMYCIINGGE